MQEEVVNGGGQRAALGKLADFLQKLFLGFRRSWRFAGLGFEDDDRALVHRVEALGQQISNQRQTLVTLRNDVESSRQQKAEEEKQLRALDEKRARSLAQAQAKAKQTESRLAQIAKDEAQQLSDSLTSTDVNSNGKAVFNTKSACPRNGMMCFSSLRRT